MRVISLLYCTGLCCSARQEGLIPDTELAIGNLYLHTKIVCNCFIAQLYCSLKTCLNLFTVAVCCIHCVSSEIILQ